MKHIKTYEKLNNIELYIDVSLFPNHVGLSDNEFPTTGTWTSFVHSRDEYIRRRCNNIIWKKYFNKKDPCEKKSLGPCRPEFKSYPQDLADTIEFFNDDVNVIDYEKSIEKKYWKYGSTVKAPVDKEELKIELKFESREDALEWLDIFEYVINNIHNEDLRDVVELKRNLKKYNL